MKRVPLALVLISAALLSGCVIVPAHRHGGYRVADHPGHHHRDSGPVYVQPGYRR